MLIQHEKLMENIHVDNDVSINDSKPGTSNEDGPFANIDLMVDINFQITASSYRGG